MRTERTALIGAEETIKENELDGSIDSTGQTEMKPDLEEVKLDKLEIIMPTNN
jgi:hypothetical protein